jgi:general secretion pathway protein B
MSYILDALRKAEAERERERGAVPGLRSHLAPGGLAADVAAARGRTGWLWPLLAAGLVLAAGGAWLLWGDKAPATVTGTKTPTALSPPTATASGTVAAIAAAASAAAMPPPQPAVVAAAPAAPWGGPPAAAGAAVPRAPAAVPSVVAPGATKAAAAPAARPAPRPTKAAEPASVARSTGGATRVAESKSAAQPAASSAATRLPRLSELPEELQRQIPPMAIGGSVYSPQAERRMVVVNGQVLQEGASLGPELQLQQIGPKSAVLSIRGQRFEVPL